MGDTDDYKVQLQKKLEEKWGYLMTLGDLGDDHNNQKAKFILSCNEILHYASEIGDYDKISSLLNQIIPELNIESDIEINVDETVDRSEVTPLMIACREGYPDIVKILIENNANVNAVSISKTTPLIAVAQNSIMDKDDQLNIVEQLITAKANINHQDKYGKTALILAIESNSPKIVSILLLSGADINIKDQDGYNALATAELQQHSEIIEIIQDYIDKQKEKKTPVKNMGGTKKRRTIKKKNKKNQKNKSKKRKTI
jgi:ankyrin repeat protein